MLLGISLLIFLFPPTNRHLLTNFFIERTNQTSEKSNSKTTISERILPVNIQQVQSVNSYEVKRSYIGTIVPRRNSSFGFEQSGKLKKIVVDEGDRVKAGTLLAFLDTKTIKAQKRELFAQKAQLVAQLKELQAGARSQTIAAARANVKNLTSQLQLARLKNQRRKELHTQGAISRERLDEATSNLNEVQAKLEEVQSQLNKTLAGTRPERIEAQKASNARINALIASKEIELEKSVLKAPFSGTIAANLVDEGTVVSVGTPILRLVEDGVLEARIGVPVTTAKKMQIGTKLPVKIADNNYSARILSILPELDSKTRTNTVVLRLDSAAIGKVSPNQVARLQLTETISDKGYWLPTTALVKGIKGLWSCYVLGESDKSQSFTNRSNKAFSVKQRDVEILHSIGDRVLVRGTIQDGDKVIINGTHRLMPGKLVMPTKLEK